MTFHAKLQKAQNHCVLKLRKWMDFLKPIMELDV